MEKAIGDLIVSSIMLWGPATCERNEETGGSGNGPKWCHD